MRRFKKHLCLALLLLIIVMAAAGCAGKKEDKIRIGLLPIVESLPFYVASDKGYFQSEGISVDLINFDSAVERDSAMQAGEIDGTLGDVLAVAALNNSGTPVKMVSLGLGETGQEGRFAILSSPGSGITVPGQLKNVPVAVSANSIIEYVVDNLLAEQGLKPDEIKKEVIPKIPVRFNLLLENKIKAACLPDPLAALAEAKGARLVADDTASNLSQTVIYFRDDFLAKNPGAVTKFLKAYGKAAGDINGSPDAFRPLLVEKARVPREALEVFKVDRYPAPQPPDRKQVEKVVKWMMGKGLIKQEFRYEDLTRVDLLPPSK
ncbi:MAG: ABC transporter substrate-binding protein [Peptococcaceae bacterium]|nr:ABC transporter substrate-binding protein [Peptococcaceae bacterium]